MARSCCQGGATRCQHHHRLCRHVTGRDPSPHRPLKVIHTRYSSSRKATPIDLGGAAGSSEMAAMPEATHRRCATPIRRPRRKCLALPLNPNRMGADRQGHLAREQSRPACSLTSQPSAMRSRPKKWPVPWPPSGGRGDIVIWDSNRRATAQRQRDHPDGERRLMHRRDRGRDGCRSDPERLSALSALSAGDLSVTAWSARQSHHSDKFPAAVFPRAQPRLACAPPPGISQRPSCQLINEVLATK